jgi:hypothetical protein
VNGSPFFRVSTAILPRPFAFACAVCACGVLACGGDDDGASAGSTDAGPLVCAPPASPQKPAASCEVTLESPAMQGQAGVHVPSGSAVTYCSNPPSSGPHYAIWADFQVYKAPVPAPYLVHSLEHGAVVLYWKCHPPAGAADECPEPEALVNELRKIRDNVPVDPLCVAPTRARIIIAPSKDINTEVAAAAWGATYQAACVDPPTLEAFVRDHYAKGPEDVCVPGLTF